MSYFVESFDHGRSLKLRGQGVKGGNNSRMEKVLDNDVEGRREDGENHGESSGEKRGSKSRRPRL